MDQNFRPLGATVSIAATTTSGAVALTASPTAHRDCVVYNSGTTLAFVRFGVGTQTAVATDFPVPPGAQIRIFVDDATYAAAIMASSTATIYFTSGVGS